MRPVPTGSPRARRSRAERDQRRERSPGVRASGSAIGSPTTSARRGGHELLVLVVLHDGAERVGGASPGRAARRRGTRARSPSRSSRPRRGASRGRARAGASRPRPRRARAPRPRAAPARARSRSRGRDPGGRSSGRGSAASARRAARACGSTSRSRRAGSRAATRPTSGIVTANSAEDLEQERLELVVGAVELVDEQDRARPPPGSPRAAAAPPGTPARTGPRRGSRPSAASIARTAISWRE